VNILCGKGDLKVSVLLIIAGVLIVPLAVLFDIAKKYK
jgi:hypothetical protein